MIHITLNYYVTCCFTVLRKPAITWLKFLILQYFFPYKNLHLAWVSTATPCRRAALTACKKRHETWWLLISFVILSWNFSSCYANFFFFFFRQDFWHLGKKPTCSDFRADALGILLRKVMGAVSQSDMIRPKNVYLTTDEWKTDQQKQREIADGWKIFVYTNNWRAKT